MTLSGLLNGDFNKEAEDALVKVWNTLGKDLSTLDDMKKTVKKEKYLENDFYPVSVEAIL